MVLPGTVAWVAVAPAPLDRLRITPLMSIGASLLL
jgi:hypothetical protein